MNKRWLMIAVGLWLAGVPPGRAATIYTNETDFAAGVGASQRYLNDFNDLTSPGQFAHPLNYSSNGIAYSIASIPALNLYSLVGAVSTLATNNDILVTFTNANVRAVGGWCYLTDVNGTPAAGTVTISLDDGTTVNIGTVSNSPPPFTGFISVGPVLTSLRIHGATSARYPTLDHLEGAEGRPGLSITHTPTNNLIISWPAPATGYLLQSSSQVAGPGWNNLGVAPQQKGDRMEALVTMSNAAAFYRLKKQ
jgi:hypothetical protein